MMQMIKLSGLLSIRVGLCLSLTVAWYGISHNIARAGESLEEREAHFDQAVLAFQDQEINGERRRNRDKLDQIFIEHFEPYTLSELNDASLEALYRALSKIVFHTHNEDRIEELVALSNEIQRRDRNIDPLRNYPIQLQKHHAQNTYERLINARSFDVADRFAERFKDVIQPFSANIDFESISNENSGAPALFILEDAGDSLILRQESPDISDGRWFVAVVHPGCAFSRHAMEYIENNIEKFPDMLRRNVLWITTQGSTARLESIHAWNRESDIIDIAIAYKDEDWPREILLDRTPGFYLLVDGTVSERIAGWPTDETSDELVLMLRESD